MLDAGGERAASPFFTGPKYNTATGTRFGSQAPLLAETGTRSQALPAVRCQLELVRWNDEDETSPLLLLLRVAAISPAPRQPCEAPPAADTIAAAPTTAGAPAASEDRASSENGASEGGGELDVTSDDTAAAAATASAATATSAAAPAAAATATSAAAPGRASGVLDESAADAPSTGVDRSSAVGSSPSAADAPPDDPHALAIVPALSALAAAPAPAPSPTSLAAVVVTPAVIVANIATLLAGGVVHSVEHVSSSLCLSVSELAGSAASKTLDAALALRAIASQGGRRDLLLEQVRLPDHPRSISPCPPHHLLITL